MTHKRNTETKKIRNGLQRQDAHVVAPKSEGRKKITKTRTRLKRKNFSQTMSQKGRQILEKILVKDFRHLKRGRIK